MPLMNPVAPPIAPPATKYSALLVVKLPLGFIIATIAKPTASPIGIPIKMCFLFRFGSLNNKYSISKTNKNLVNLLVWCY